MGQLLFWVDESFGIGLASDCKVVGATPKDECLKGLSHTLAHCIVTIAL